MEDLSDPLFILGLPCSYSWDLCARLGQHPQLYALPELHLFGAEYVGDWLEQCSQSGFNMEHGLLRAVAELVFKGQTESTVRETRGWLLRRTNDTTGFLLEDLAGRVHPRMLVEKSPSMVYRPEAMQRAIAMFPDSRFLHVVCHPRAYGESVMETLRELSFAKTLSSSHWLLELAHLPYSEASNGGRLYEDTDPQRAWYVLNRQICDFLESVPPDQQMRISCEALYRDVAASLKKIVTWLRLSTNAEDLEMMQHPEHSPYYHQGPPGAMFGTDLFLPHPPGLNWNQQELQDLNAPLGWCEDERFFLREVKHLARDFGYS
jgi:Sulfotransferase family